MCVPATLLTVAQIEFAAVFLESSREEKSFNDALCAAIQKSPSILISEMFIAIDFATSLVKALTRGEVPA